MSDLLKRAYRAALCTAAFREFTQIGALLIDSMIICRYLGLAEIAAVGIAAPFFYVVGIVSTGIAFGLQTICSKELGCGRIKEMNRITNEALLFAGAISVLLTSVSYAAARPLAILFGARRNAEVLLSLTVLYLRGLSFEIMPYVLLSVLSPVVILDNGSKTVVASSIAGGVTNVLLDLVVVTHHGGIRGIGLATSTASTVSFLVLMTHYLRKKRLLHLRFTRIRWRDIGQILKLSGPMAMHQVAGVFRPIFLHGMTIAAGGSIAMSVMTIRESLTDFVDIPAVGISGALGLLVGLEYGERNGDDMEKTCRLAHRYVCVASAAIAVFLLTFSRMIAGFYLGVEVEALPGLIFAIGTIAAETVFRELLFCRIAFLQATEKTREAQQMLGAYFISPLLCAFLLSIPFGVNGIYAALPVSQLIVIAGVFLLSIRKSRPSLRHYLRMDASHFTSPEYVTTKAFETMEDCCRASEQTIQFCEEHGVDHRKSMLAGLCVEEISRNILQHGFVHKSRHNGAEIRVTMVDDDLIIRVRDNGVEFDLSTMARIVADEKDLSHNIGTKLISQSAKDISYYRIWGMNNVILRV